MKNIHKINNNIYITSDEEIKEGDWFLTDDKRVEKCAPDWRAREWHKKIILTTDQDLIKDGVQTIDDEFLEWFVKNPSCEEVGVENIECQMWYLIGCDKDDVGCCGKPFKGYKIIIPKEEPTIVRLPPYYESKQETLEEVAEKLTKDFPHYSVRESMDDSDIKGWFLEALQKGAKWMQERMYSEEDLKEAFFSGCQSERQIKPRIKCWEQWFEQFKKKVKWKKN